MVVGSLSSAIASWAKVYLQCTNSSTFLLKVIQTQKMIIETQSSASTHILRYSYLGQSCCERGVGDGGADSRRSPLPRSASHGSKPNDVHTKPHVLYRL